MKIKLADAQSLADHSDMLPAVLNLMDACLRRHEAALRVQSIDQEGAERKLLISRARYDGMKQLIVDFQSEFVAAIKS